MRRSPAVWFASYGMSLLGAGIASVVMPLLVLERTGDVLAAGVLATVTTAAAAATGLLSGLLVDRIDRRVVAVVSDLLSALSLAALPVVDALWGLDMTAFLVLGLLGAVIRVPGMTAQESVLPVLARLGDVRPGRLDRLIATRETVGNVLLLAGPGLGGLLVGLLGLSPALVLTTAATSVAAAVLTLVLDPRVGVVGPRDRTQPGGPVRRAVTDLVVSWRFLVRHRLVLGATLVGATFVAVLSSLQSTLMPAYFTAEDLPALTGLTLSAIAAGSIAGSALYAATTGRVRRRTWFVIGMTGTLVGFVAVGSMASPWLVLAGAALVGLTERPGLGRARRPHRRGHPRRDARPGARRAEHRHALRARPDQRPARRRGRDGRAARRRGRDRRARRRHRDRRPRRAGVPLAGRAAGGAGAPHGGRARVRRWRRDRSRAAGVRCRWCSSPRASSRGCSPGARGRRRGPSPDRGTGRRRRARRAAWARRVANDSGASTGSKTSRV